MSKLNTPLWQLTLGEVLEAIEMKIASVTPISEIENPVLTEPKELVYGLAGLARLVGCSKNHAWKLKADGVFDGAIIQNNRLIIVDKEKALELFDKRNS